MKIHYDGVHAVQRIFSDQKKQKTFGQDLKIFFAIIGIYCKWVCCKQVQLIFVSAESFFSIFYTFFSDEQFNGTVFWFPLRQKSSKLSKTVYSQRRVQQLTRGLRTEVNTLLLFLKRVERLEVYSDDGDGQSSPPMLEFSVGVNEECVEAVQLDRDHFLSAITTQDKTCPRKEVCFMHSSQEANIQTNTQIKIFGHATCVSCQTLEYSDCLLNLSL